MVRISFSKLDGFLDLQGKFGMIKEMIYNGVPRAQVLAWVGGEIAKTVSLASRWRLEDGTVATGAQFREAAMQLCTKWADCHLAEMDKHSQPYEQMRLKM